MHEPAASFTSIARPRSRFKAALFVIGGIGALLAALLSSSESIERLLRGESTGALRWGPALFRSLLAFHGVALLVAACVATREKSIAVLATKGTRAPWLLLTLLAAVAALLRLIRLDTCLWYDEVLTFVDFLRHPLREIVTSFPSQNQHMLYSIAGRLSVDLFGENAAAARVPAVLFGVASTVALFFLGRRIATPLEAWFAAILMTVSYHHVWFSQNARGYTGLLLFTTLSSWLWIEAQARGTTRHWIGYAAAIALGVCVHSTMLFVVAAHGLLYLTSIARGNRWKPIVAWLFAGTASLQLLSLSFPEFLSKAIHEGAEHSDWQNPLWLVQEALRQSSGGGLLSAGFLLAAVIGAFVVGCGVWSYLRENVRSAGLLTLPAILCAIAIVAARLNLWPRFFFFCLGLLLLILVRGLFVVGRWMGTAVADVERRTRVGKAAGVALCTLAIFASASTVPRVYAFPKQDFSGARDFVEQSRQPDDAVAAVGLAGTAYKKYFEPAWMVVERRAELDELRRQHPEVWLVYTIPVQLAAWHPDIWECVQHDFEVVKSFHGTLGGGDVVVCRARFRSGGDRHDH